MTSGPNPEPGGPVQFVGFDSAWADNAKAPGAISSVHFDGVGFTDFRPPQLVGFGGALVRLTTRGFGPADDRAQRDRDEAR